MQPQLTWRDMQPILLRSAAVVGLAAAVAAAIANDGLFANSQPTSLPEATVLIVEKDREQAPSPPAPADHAVAAADTRSTALSSGGPAKARLAHVTTDASAPQPMAGQAAVRPAEAAARPAEIGHTPEPRVPEASAALAAPSTSAASAGPAQEPATVGSIGPATECPRNWLDTAGGGQPAAGGVHCAETAAVSAEPAAEQSALEEAASEHASEIAALQFVPRIPVARPDPPPRPRKTGRKASWPADDPPNCGKKRARWRYVNEVPTWYCR